MGDFEVWWSSFPRKVGKLAAKAAYEKARKMATAEELLDGVKRYIRSKPAYADWCHAKTWLGQGRWMDEFETVDVTTFKPFVQPEDWYAECGRLHNHACGLSQHVHHTRKILDAGRGAK